MRSDETSAGPETPAVPDEPENSPSRREFLGSAVAGVLFSTALPALAASPAPEHRSGSTPSDPLEQLLRRYGSEFGHITRIV